MTRLRAKAVFRLAFRPISIRRLRTGRPCLRRTQAAWSIVILLSRYILAHFIRNLGMIMAAFISIYLLIDFFEKFDNFLERGKSLALVARFFLCKIPFIIDMMSPVCILLAGVVTLGLLNSSNELIALKSCGIPLRKIVRPLIGAAAGCIALFLLMSQFVLPRTITITNEIWNKEVKERTTSGIYRNGRYYYRGAEGFYSFARPDPRKNAFRFFSYVAWDADSGAGRLLAAQESAWDGDLWILHRGQELDVSDGTPHSRVFDSLRLSLPEQPEDFFVPEYHTMELSLFDLYKEARHAGNEEERARAWADFYGRISYTLLGLPLMLLGLPLMLSVYRKWGRDLSLAIPVSCGMAFVCWGAYTTLQSLAKAGYLYPLAAALSIHVLIGSLGAFLLWREDR